MFLWCQPHAEYFQLRVDVVEMPASCWRFPSSCWCFWDASVVLMISNFVLMLLRCELHVEDFHPCVDVDDAPAFMLWCWCCINLCCYWWWWWCINVILIHVDADDDDAILAPSYGWWYWWWRKTSNDLYICQSVFKMLLMLLPSISPDDVVEYPSCQGKALKYCNCKEYSIYYRVIIH